MNVLVLLNRAGVWFEVSSLCDIMVLLILIIFSCKCSKCKLQKNPFGNIIVFYSHDQYDLEKLQWLLFDT